MKTPAFDFHNAVSILIMVLIITIGVVGSCFNLYVFSRKTMRKHTTFHFLLYLSLIDILVLGFCSSNALLLYGFDFDLKNLSDWSCRIEAFLTSFLRHLSRQVGNIKSSTAPVSKQLLSSSLTVEYTISGLMKSYLKFSNLLNRNQI